MTPTRTVIDVRAAALHDDLARDLELAVMHAYAFELTGGSSGPTPEPPEPTDRAWEAYHHLRDRGLWQPDRYGPLR